MKTIRTIAILCSVFLVGSLQAQMKDSVSVGELPSDIIEVIKSFRPTITEASVIAINPEFPQIKQGNSELNNSYELPKRQVDVDALPPKIKPVSYRMPKEQDVHHFWLKGGYGNISSPLVELSATTGQSDKFTGGVSGYYNSSEMSKVLRSNTDFGGKIYGRYIFDSFAVSGDIGLDNTKYSFVGDSISDIAIDTLFQEYSLFNADIQMKSNIDDYNGFDYGGFLNTKILFDDSDSKETQVSIGANFYNQHETGIKYGGDISFISTTLNNGIAKFDKSIFNIHPNVSFRKPRYYIAIGANIFNESEAGFGIGPALYGEVSVIEKKALLFGSFNTSYQQFGLIQALDRNPYYNVIHSDDSNNLLLSAIQNYKQSALKAGINGNINGKWQYQAAFALNRFENYSQFIHVPNNVFSFTLENYGDFNDAIITQINPSLEVNRQITKNSIVGLRFDYFNWQDDADIEIVHSYLPKFKSSLFANVTLIEKLNISTNIAILHPGEFFDNLNDKVKDMKTIFDVNFEIKYYFTKNIGAFVRVDNLASQQQERYNGYPSYELRAIGGVQIKL